MAIKKSALAMAWEQGKKENAARVMKGVATLRKNARALEGAYGRAAAVRAEDFFTMDGGSVSSKSERASSLAERYVTGRQDRRSRNSLVR